MAGEEPGQVTFLMFWMKILSMRGYKQDQQKDMFSYISLEDPVQPIVVFFGSDC